MEMVITVCVGVLGAVATIVAAYIQKGKQEAQSVSSVEKQKAAMIQQAQGVQVTLIFPGSRLFSECAYFHYSYVEVHLDGKRMGSGDGQRGFNITFTTTVGLHDLVLRWERVHRNSAPEFRTEMEIVLNEPGACVIRLGFSADHIGYALGRSSGNGFFRVRKFEPRRAGYVALSGRGVLSLLLGGIGLIAVSGFILWRMFK